MKALSMTLKLLLWLVKLAVDAAPADQSRLVSSLEMYCKNKRFCPPTLRLPTDGTYKANLLI